MDFKKKRVSKIILAISLVITFAVLSLFIFKIYTTVKEAFYNPAPVELEYRTDLEPLATTFPILSDSEACYWKTASINASIAPGPTDYYTKGFVVLSRSTFEQLLKDYKWQEDIADRYPKVEFEEGIDPEVTGYKDFDWYWSREFKSELLGGRFMGDLYLDMNHGILFIDISTY